MVATKPKCRYCQNADIKQITDGLELEPFTKLFEGKPFKAYSCFCCGAEFSMLDNEPETKPEFIIEKDVPGTFTEQAAELIRRANADGIPRKYNLCGTWVTARPRKEHPECEVIGAPKTVKISL